MVMRFLRRTKVQKMARMNGLSDSLTIGIMLVLIFGAVSFYLYSKIGQLEKKMSLLENLLISLKMSTEASLSGPDSIEAISGPFPIAQEDIDTDTNEEEYSALLKQIPSSTPLESDDTAESESDAEMKSLASVGVESVTPAVTQTETSVLPKIDVNYEGMSVKELQQLAKNRGLVNIPGRKKELIELLKSMLPGIEEAEGEEASDL
jgi:hypothetical protein